MFNAARRRARRARSRLIGNDRFRRAAAAIPGIRRIARSRANALFDLTAGFAYSQALFALVELDLIERCLDGASAATLADEVELPDAALVALLDAGVALGILARIGDSYFIGDLGAALLGEPGLVAMVRHHALTYRDLVDPVALLRGATRPETAAFWQYAGGRAAEGTTPDGAARYSELMAATQGFVAREVVDAYRFGRHHHLVDVGGGTGAFAVAAARDAPRLRVTVFDLPDVAPLAARRLEAAGLAARATAIGGSFHDGELPRDGDVYTLVRVLYDHDDAPALALLQRLREAMPDGATLLVAEPMADLPGHPHVGAYFAMYLAAMRSGRCRSPQRIIAMLDRAGFRAAKRRRVRSPLFTGLVSART